MPSTITFVPKEGGRHLIRLAEAAHNLWWGRLELDVAGDVIDSRGLT